MFVIQITSKGCIHFKETIINNNECWEYIGPAYFDNDYPIIYRLYKNWIASRFVWFIFTKRDYSTREIHHKCRNKICVNPEHLEEWSKRKHRKWHNKYG